MTKPKLKHINRPLTDEERARHEKIRAEVEKEIPPAIRDKPQPANGIAEKICRAREEQGLTWYAVSKKANVSQSVVRDIELGKDVRLSAVEAVAEALGLELRLVKQVA